MIVICGAAWFIPFLIKMSLSFITLVSRALLCASAQQRHAGLDYADSWLSHAAASDSTLLCRVLWLLLGVHPDMKSAVVTVAQGGSVACCVELRRLAPGLDREALLQHTKSLAVAAALAGSAAKLRQPVRRILKDPEEVGPEDIEIIKAAGISLRKARVAHGGALLHAAGSEA